MGDYAPNELEAAMNIEATDKQKELVSRFGLSTEELTKLDAMQILTRVMCRAGA